MLGESQDPCNMAYNIHRVWSIGSHVCMYHNLALLGFSDCDIAIAPHNNPWAVVSASAIPDSDLAM